MLLSKAGVALTSAASGLQAGEGRNGLVGRDGVRKSGVRRVKVVQVRANAGDGAGRSSSSSSGSAATSIFNRVGSFLNRDRVEQQGAEVGGDKVVYKGTFTIMKKLAMLDLMDRGADLQDDATELMGKRVTVQLVSTEVDRDTGKALVSRETAVEGWVAVNDKLAAQDISFPMDFVVPKGFGVPGAIIVKNQHPNEFLLVSFSLAIPDADEAHYLTNSWVYNTANTEGRIFFQNKAYLPGDTPDGMKELREKELQDHRGDGTGERKASDRIYDYDVYNDLGKPDEDPALERPNLGGNAEYPYPRRCRTGRPPSKFNPAYESRKGVATFYIPRDECFERAKMSDFKADGMRSKGHALTSKVKSLLTKKKDFESIAAIKELYAPKGKDLGGMNNVLPEMSDIPKSEQQPLIFLEELINPDGERNTPLKYPLPMILHVDENAWQTNEQFAREFLAGLNPVMISLVKEFPLKSALDPKEFGDPTSAITAHHIEGALEGFSVEEALSKKKLFVADYHDAYLPFVERINAQKDAKTYATRALFFLSSDETLKVLALELVLPPTSPGGEKISKVFTPPKDYSAAKMYLWQCARAHVANNDIVAHQVFSHFSKCHAVTEALIIATNRQLSKLHPIHHLMAPHFKSTLEINRGARARLIPAGGVIEASFTPRAYSMRMAAANYRDTWTFDSQALPNDLIARGMAVPDPSAKHGVKLVVEDYPYAADGLELWSAIKSWNTDYVDIYYQDDAAVQNDVELQKWWSEFRYVGHADKKDAPGWPDVNSKENLVEVLTSSQWICSCQHAAINFGQYAYAGFMPHHPTSTRRLIPDEGTKEWEEFQRNPEKFYLSTISDVNSATTTMSVYEVLSSHAANEIYIGDRAANWAEDKRVNAAFKRFSKKLADIDELIKGRNADKNLKNRMGPAQLPYNLLRPSSKPGVTAMGIPNSITI
ncbi:hypothetical protein M758_10G059600 [Ceratodon purpureus]|nr:hypothetical protein M758_10G059600 [Ceratodon purpureus]